MSKVGRFVSAYAQVPETRYPVFPPPYRKLGDWSRRELLAWREDGENPKRRDHAGTGDGTNGYKQGRGMLES